jgi:hypothetical protein
MRLSHWRLLPQTLSFLTGCRDRVHITKGGSGENGILLDGTSELISYTNDLAPTVVLRDQ